MITVFRQGSTLADGRYVLERRLGAGGMATVWLATDDRLQRSVAIKLPSDALSADPTFARRFEREARAAAAVSHPNLVPVYDYGTEGDRPYLVSEFIDGASLAQLRDRGEAPEIGSLARSLLAALGQIHAAGIVHRDIKPANVLVEGPDRILITDFGIAQSTEETSLTKTGNVIGTYDYLAPEVKRGERAGAASDLYACGVLLGEQLRESDPSEVHELVRRLTAPEPGARPPDAVSALAVLDGNAAATAPTAQLPIEQETPAFEQPTPRPVEQPPPRPAAQPPRVRTRPPQHVLDDRDRPPTRSTALAGSGISPRAIALGLVIVAALAVAVIALASSGGDEPNTERSASSGSGNNGAAAEETSTSSSTTESTSTTESPTTPVAPVTEEAIPSGDDPATGAQLNDEGFALLQAEDYAGALPVLEQAVASFPADSADPNYHFALFNYAQALRFSGDPAAAIPYLEKRIELSDDRDDVVEAELKLAEKEAKKAG